ncbi:MAG: enoyl-CoA hydratase-related protein [Caulobacteraceae bacterium]
MSDNPIADPLVENVIVDDVASVVTLDATPEGVATVTINRPDKRNAMNQLVIEGLTEAFETLQGAEGVRIVFLRGAGEAFCAGADLEWMRAAADYSEGDNRDDAMALAKMLKELSRIPVLTVALVHGRAMGGGAGLAAVCDYAAATQNAMFAFSEAKLGLIPAMISPYVVNAIGPRYARPLFMTGQAFDAAYAEKIGLVHEVVADAAGLDAVRDRLTAEAMTAAPEAAAEAKKLVWDVWARPINHDLMDETAKRIARKRVSDEGQEGVRAFLDKRKPSWSK